MKDPAVSGEYQRDAVMTPSALTMLAAFCGALALLAAPAARAGETPCPSISVDADPGVTARWPDLTERVRGAFAGRLDVDRCATVHLTLAGPSIQLQVVLPEGRSTSRLARAEDVLSGLQALLLVPEQPPPPPVAAPPQDTRGPGSATHFESTALEVRSAGTVEARAAGEGPRRFGFELSLGAGLRRGDGQTSTGVFADSLVEAAHWLAGFAARLDRYDGAGADSGDAQTAAQVGLLLGRRFRFGHSMFDAAAGPALAYRGGWRVAPAPGSTGTTNPARSSSSDGLLARGLLTGRLILGAGSTVRAFVGLEGEVGQGGPIPPGATRGLPTWTVGAALGVTVGTL